MNKTATATLSERVDDWKGSAACLNISLDNFTEFHELVLEILEDEEALQKKIKRLKDFDFKFHFNVSRSSERHQE